MKLDIWRKIETQKSITGELCVDGKFLCYTLEPSRTHPIHAGHPCISAGTYDIKLTRSPHFGYVTPEVLNVPERTAIRIHPANWPKELLGCTAVGDILAVDAVYKSQAAFYSLMQILGGIPSDEQITGEWHDVQ